jgi:Lon protease-like protein
MNEELLPLFPLHAVLFPNSALPLYIFEERYKLLIGKSVADGSSFGINLTEGKMVTAVGCSALVREVIRTYDDGRMDIVVEGCRRYRIGHYSKRPSPYLLGVVEYLEPVDEEPDSELACETVRLYKRLAEKVYTDGRFQVEADQSFGPLSFRLAQKAGMDLVQRQRVLEQDSENQRLEMIRSYLEHVLPKVERVEEIARIIRSDGYL